MASEDSGVLNKGHVAVTTLKSADRCSYAFRSTIRQLLQSVDSNCPDALTETHFPMILSKTRASKIRMWAALGLQCSGGPSLMVSLAVPLSFSLSSLSF